MRSGATGRRTTTRSTASARRTRGEPEVEEAADPVVRRLCLKMAGAHEGLALSALRKRARARTRELAVVEPRRPPV
jgi:hypothetical protein